MFFPLFRGSKRFVLCIASLLIAVVALVDWLTNDNIPLGFLYLGPMLMLGRVLRPWQTGMVAALCTMSAELFDPFPFDLRSGMPRDALYFAAFFTIGLFVRTLDGNRNTMLEQLHEIERQRDARQAAEEQLQVLIDTSPAAIVTTDSDGMILMANDAAKTLLNVEEALPGSRLGRYFPALANIPGTVSSGRVFRAVMQARGYRADNEAFLAEICFSTYATRSGPRLAAMILDTSEELRTREESSLHQMLAGSRLAVSAVSHEIRNVCGAIGVVHQNLSRRPLLSQSEDFAALGSLVLALQQIASVDLLQYPAPNSEVDLASLLDDLRIVISPALQEHNIDATWEVDPDLSMVQADTTGLLQIFLNLANNSIRALQQQTSSRKIEFVARRSAGRCEVEIRDSGGGVLHPDELFRPFQAGAHATGLGLYLSRAFARSFGGDLVYRPLPGMARFVVDLAIARPVEPTS